MHTIMMEVLTGSRYFDKNYRIRITYGDSLYRFHTAYYYDADSESVKRLIQTLNDWKVRGIVYTIDSGIMIAFEVANNFRM